MTDTALQVDLVILGGGIIGAGVARDAAGRGIKTALIDCNDIASGTSSYSSKLLHGGIRYLENFHFSLVKESLSERTILQNIAPHLCWQSEFRIPWRKNGRSRLLLRTGIAIYDYLAGATNNTPKGRYVTKTQWDKENPNLRTDIQCGFGYGDCRTNDARLVVENVLSAKQHGALIYTYTTCVSVEQKYDHWVLTFVDEQKRKIVIKSLVVLQATGPWIKNQSDLNPLHAYAPERLPELVKGSHIVVPALYQGDHSYLLMNYDGRVVFVIPFEDSFSLIGTTELPFAHEPRECKIETQEIEYLLEIVGKYFLYKPKSSDILWSFSGVRALLPSSKTMRDASREYFYERKEYRRTWWCNVYGGKLTSYRLVSESIVNDIAQALGNTQLTWTKDVALPGSESYPKQESKADILEIYKKRYYWLPVEVLDRWLHVYGSRIGLLLNHCTSIKDLGKEIAPGVFAKELAYVVNHEHVKKAEDYLYRRSRMFLYLNSDECKKIEDEIDRLQH